MLERIQITWLLWEGLVPLFGASTVYLASGFYKQLASPGSKFAWSAAADSMGWLYGALIIAVQSAVRFFEAGPQYIYAGIGCIICIFACGMQLLAGMHLLHLLEFRLRSEIRMKKKSEVVRTQGFTKFALAFSAGASAGMPVLLFDPMAIVPAALMFAVAALVSGAWLVWVEREPAA